METMFAVPPLDKFPTIEDNRIPGEVIFGVEDVIINRGRKAVILRVVNIGDRPIQVFCKSCLSDPFYTQD